MTRALISEKDLQLLHHAVAEVTGGVFSYLQTTRPLDAKGARYTWSSAGSPRSGQTFFGAKGGRSLSAARAVGLLMGWARFSGTNLGDEVVQAAKRVMSGLAKRWTAAALTEKVLAEDEAGAAFTAANTIKVKGVDGRPFNVVARGTGPERERGLRMIEFYDASQDPAKFTDLGQFVSRYYLETLEERNQGFGLNLEGGVDVWAIGTDEMLRVNRWLATLG